MTLTNSIDWLEIISAPDARRSAMQTHILQVDTGGQICYGVRVDDQWVVGQDVAVMFDSPEAASRFISMVGIEDATSTDPIESPGINCRSSRQCFHLSPMGGLGSCPLKKSLIWQDALPANEDQFKSIHA